MCLFAHQYYQVTEFGAISWFEEKQISNFVHDLTDFENPSHCGLELLLETNGQTTMWPYLSLIKINCINDSTFIYQSFDTILVEFGNLVRYILFCNILEDLTFKLM